MNIFTKNMFLAEDRCVRLGFDPEQPDQFPLIVISPVSYALSLWRKLAINGHWATSSQAKPRPTCRRRPPN